MKSEKQGPDVEYREQRAHEAALEFAALWIKLKLKSNPDLLIEAEGQEKQGGEFSRIYNSVFHDVYSAKWLK